MGVVEILRGQSPRGFVGPGFYSLRVKAVEIFFTSLWNNTETAEFKRADAARLIRGLLLDSCVEVVGKTLECLRAQLKLHPHLLFEVIRAPALLGELLGVFETIGDRHAGTALSLLVEVDSVSTSRGGIRSIPTSRLPALWQTAQRRLAATHREDVQADLLRGMGYLIRIMDSGTTVPEEPLKQWVELLKRFSHEDVQEGMRGACI